MSTANIKLSQASEELILELARSKCLQVLLISFIFMCLSLP